jgi:hypothetical protein
MTQPKFAPIAIEDEVRPSYHLKPAQPWTAHRPSEFVPGSEVGGKGLGAPGPDQGYALHLARRFVDRLVLTDGEQPEDVLSGAVAVALRRASLFGRAPIAADIELPLVCFGYLTDAPTDLVAVRSKLFGGVAHDYWARGALAEHIPESTLRRSPAAVAPQLKNWRSLIDA